MSCGARLPAAAHRSLQRSGRPPGPRRHPQARAELSLRHIDLRQIHEKADGVVLSGTALLEKPGRKTRQLYAVFGLMFAGVLLVLLLLACANVGNLLLA